jgi:hypothetical protein
MLVLVHNMVTKHTEQARVQDEKKDYPALKQSPGPADAEQVDNVEECQPTVVTNGNFFFHLWVNRKKQGFYFFLNSFQFLHPIS